MPLQDPHLSLMAVPVGSLDAQPPSLGHVETFTADAVSFFKDGIQENLSFTLDGPSDADTELGAGHRTETLRRRPFSSFELFSARVQSLLE